jgi:hypothetical protein
MGSRYASMGSRQPLSRREFVRGATVTGAVLGGALMGVGLASGQEKTGADRPAFPATNLDEFMKVPRGPHALPGPFPGKVVQVTDRRSVTDDRVDAAVVRRMFEQGVTRLTGRSMAESFDLLFTRDDVVGLKVNPVGPPLINTRHELADAVIAWLVAGGLPKRNIVIWDRFDYMLRDAGFTADRFPGVGIEGLQTMDEEGDRWKDATGRHKSAPNFDQEAFFFVEGVEGKNVRGYKDDEFYMNQHVFAGERSYFGKLVSRRLTKIINLPVFKNSGPGISMATKNLGYGALCNTGRLHAPLGYRVCTEVLAAPWVRDKLVLNVTDALRGQYEDGPALNAQFVYPARALYFATDPFALDTVCFSHLMAKRTEMGLRVDPNPRYSEYLAYGERLGLGVASPDKIALHRILA